MFLTDFHMQKYTGGIILWVGIFLTVTPDGTGSPLNQTGGAVVRALDSQLTGCEFNPDYLSNLIHFIFSFFVLKSITSRLPIKMLKAFYKRVYKKIYIFTSHN